MAGQDDPRAFWVRVLDAIAANPWWDLALAATVLCTHGLIANLRDHVWTLAKVSPDQRVLVYGALATVAALAAGANNTAIGAYVSSQGDAMKRLRETNGAAMRRALRSVGLWLWAVSVTAVFCLVLDPTYDSRPSFTRGASFVAEAAALVLVIKFMRLTLMQDIILRANDLSASPVKKKRVVARRRTSAARDNSEQ